MEKELIFTITTGRSGTQYLANLLYFIDKADVVHESYPDFVNFINSDYEKKIDFLKEKKIKYINTLPKNIYIETSHLFCKGFLLPLIDIGIVPKIIILKRNNREVAQSILSLNAIPTKTEIGKKYYPIGNYNELEKLSDYQLCYLYTLEIDIRTTIYTNFLKQFNTKIFYLKFEELFKIKTLFRIRKELNLPRITLKNKIKYIQFQRRKTIFNNKSELKKKIKAIDFEQEEKEVIKFLLAQKNYSNG